MSKFRIKGGNPITGKITSEGNKNAVLKMIPATLLTSEPVTLTNVPSISDVRVMLDIMKELGTNIDYDKDNKRVTLHTPEIKTHKINGELASKLRASNMFLGPVLARAGKVENVFPGGDQIGPREMTAHFDGFTQLGASFKKGEEDKFELNGDLTASDIFLYEPSVTATENTLLAAVLSKGSGSIYNAACEPHVQELALMLNEMGAKISGIGTNKLVFEGVEELHGVEYKVPPDYMYITTFMIFALVTGGELTIEDVNHDDMVTILYFFDKLGVKTEARGDSLFIPGNQELKIDNPVWARTKGFYSQPWPGFSTDVMSFTIVLATQTEGSTLFFEKMYPGRMFFAEYLNGMGANIFVSDPHRLIVNGKTKLKGRKGMQCPDIRAGVAYVAAALCAEGITEVTAIDHIDRGYPNLEVVLKELGADIERVE